MMLEVRILGMIHRSFVGDRKFEETEGFNCNDEDRGDILIRGILWARGTDCIIDVVRITATHLV
jgi:hypothetical protein